MNELIVALGLVLVIEGLLYAAFAGPAKRMLETLREVPESTLRTGGVMAMAAGVLIVWLAHG